MTRTLSVLAIALTLVAGSLAEAKSKKNNHKNKKGDGSPDVQVTIVIFGDSERHAARGYFEKKHGRGKCPPGLAKKRNGCLPPGQAKKRYVVGEPLREEIVVEVLPPELSVRVGAPPRGYRYGIIDGDLVKLAVGTMLVVDAIDGLVQ